MTRYEAYLKARKEFLKKKEREVKNYQQDACHANRRGIESNKKTSQKYV